MTKLKLGPLVDDKPVRLTVELPAQVHREAPTTHSVIKRQMGVFEFKGGKVTPKAFFGIDGADYKKA